MAMRVAATGCRGLVGPRGLGDLLYSTTQSQTPYPSTRLFVSGLSKFTTSAGLRRAFAKFGELVYAKVMTDRVSGFSKSFGFVKYATIKEAQAGIKSMDGQFLDGWVISVQYARPMQPPSPLQNNYTDPYGR